MPSTACHSGGGAAVRWHGRGRGVPTTKRQSCGASVARGAAPSPPLATHRWRPRGSSAMTAAPPARPAWSGSHKGGLAPGPRAPEDAPAARGGRDHGAGARRAAALGRGPEGGAPPAPRGAVRGDRRQAAPARAAGGDAPAPSPRGLAHAGGRPCAPSPPQVWAGSVPRLERPGASADQEGSGTGLGRVSFARTADHRAARGLTGLGAPWLGTRGGLCRHTAAALHGGGACTRPDADLARAAPAS
jgi:hypothetical protein